MRMQSAIEKYPINILNIVLKLTNNKKYFFCWVKSISSFIQGIGSCIILPFLGCICGTTTYLKNNFYNYKGFFCSFIL